MLSRSSNRQTQTTDVGALGGMNALVSALPDEDFSSAVTTTRPTRSSSFTQQRRKERCGSADSASSSSSSSTSSSGLDGLPEELFVLRDRVQRHLQRNQELRDLSARAEEFNAVGHLLRQHKASIDIFFCVFFFEFVPSFISQNSGHKNKRPSMPSWRLVHKSW